MPLSDLEISEDVSLTAVVEASKTSRDHGVGELGKNTEASSSQSSFQYSLEKEFL